MRKHNGKYDYKIETLTREDDISYYLLGAFITDGCVKILKDYKYATITSKDEDWLKGMRATLCPEKPIHNRKNNDKNIYVLNINNTSICDWLIAHNCVPTKSRIVELPEVPKQYLPDFIRGCMDGDGSLGTYRCHSKSNGDHIRRNCSFATGSEKFAKQLHILLDGLNFKHCLYVRTKTSLNKRGSKINGRKIKSNGNFYSISFSGRSAYNFLQWIYYQHNRLSMPRKNTLAQEIIQHYQSIQV